MPEAPAMLDAMGPAVQDSAVANAKRELAGGNALPQQSAAKLIPKNSRPHALARVPDRFKRRQNDFSSRSECARLPAFPASLRLDISSRDLAPRACVTGYASPATLRDRARIRLVGLMTSASRIVLGAIAFGFDTKGGSASAVTSYWNATFRDTQCE